MRIHEQDTEFRNSVERFCRHFNCACSRLTKMGVIISCADVSLKVAGLHERTNNTINWQVNNMPNQLGQVVIHPLALLLAGHRIRTRNFYRDDIDTYYDMRGGCHAFIQGFANIPGWRDCWNGYRITSEPGKYYSSLYFNLGRAFLNKAIGIYLTHNLPVTYAKMFSQLK